MSGSQQPNIESESWPYQQANSQYVRSFEHRIQVLGTPHDIAERGTLQELQKPVEQITFLRVMTYSFATRVDESYAQGFRYNDPPSTDKTSQFFDACIRIPAAKVM
jgi:hypothetical protein